MEVLSFRQKKTACLLVNKFVECHNFNLQNFKGYIEYTIGSFTQGSFFSSDSVKSFYC